MIFKPHVLRKRVQALMPLFVFGAIGLYVVWPWLPLHAQPTPTRTVVFYGFSILGDVMIQGIFPAFQDEWEQATGERVEFIGSFAGSGTVTNQLIMGVPAELAILSTELDAQRLVDAGLIPADSWRDLPHGGVVNRTPFIMLVRPNNPKNINDFADLARPGVKIVHPDPLTSGAANWSIVAEYGAGSHAHPDDPDAGYEILLGIWRNVVAQASSARAARSQFDNGFGDALVTYEQEAVWDRTRGQLQAGVVYPHSTILSEHTLVVIDRNVSSDERELIDAFVRFLWTDTAQRIFVEYGFRSVDEPLNAENELFGTIADPFLIADVGGWPRAKQEIVDDIWKNRVLQELSR